MNVQGFRAAEAAQILGDSPQAVAKRSLAHEERLQERDLAFVSQIQEECR